MFLTTNMASLFVCVPGFGAPEIELKCSILSKNLQIIKQYPWSKLHVRICVYDNTRIPEETLAMHPEIEVIYEKGIVGEFIHRYANPNAMESFTHCLLLLDDIELQQNINIDRMLYLIEYFKLDILSPSLTMDSKHVYKYMLTAPSHMYEMKFCPACEMFCYLMPLKSYQLYYPHVDCNNPWMWGLDLILERQLRLHVGIMNTMTMRHHLHNTAYSLHPNKDPEEGYKYLRSKYNEKLEDLQNQPAVRFVVFPTTQS